MNEEIEVRQKITCPRCNEELDTGTANAIFHLVDCYNKLLVETGNEE